MWIKATLGGLATVLILAGCQSEEDKAREVLAEALQNYAQMQDTTGDTQARLEAGKAVEQALTLIVQDYGKTDLGLEIAAGGSVGAFSSTSLKQQIVELEAQREYELCDQVPTPTCVIERLARDNGYETRKEFLLDTDPSMASALAMAAGDTDLVNAIFKENPSTEPAAELLAFGAASIVAPYLKNLDTASWDYDTTEMMSVLAAFDVIAGDTSDEAREIVKLGQSGQSLLGLSDIAENLETFVQQIDSLGEDQIDWDIVRGAEEFLASTGQVTSENMFITILKHRFGDQAALDFYLADYGDKGYEYIFDLFAKDAVSKHLLQIAAAPETEARDLSLLLMAGAVHMTGPDLTTLIDTLGEREVMKWDNLRVYAPLIAVAYEGDRAQFDKVRAILTPVEIHEYLEDAWATGVALSQGKIANATLEDNRIFRAAVSVASARGASENQQGFLSDAAEKLDPNAKSYDRPVGPSDVVNAAAACGYPQIIPTINGYQTVEIGRPNGSCDRANLKTRLHELSAEAFETLVANADQIVAANPMLIVEGVEFAPERVFEITNTVTNSDLRSVLTTILALSLAGKPQATVDG